MGKRSSFERNPRDYYKTPFSAVEALIARKDEFHIRSFAEPCAGDGSLARHLGSVWRCVELSDIEPQAPEVAKRDAFDITETEADCFITNPPWSRDVMHPLLEHIVNIKPVWFLLDSDWCHTRQASLYMKNFCVEIISIGRVKWIENSANTGKDNCCWYLFDKDKTDDTIFIGR